LKLMIASVLGWRQKRINKWLTNPFRLADAGD
jgi:hypothetical protein